MRRRKIEFDNHLNSLISHTGTDDGHWWSNVPQYKMLYAWLIFNYY